MGNKIKHILCICNGGNVRSVALAEFIKNQNKNKIGIEAIAIGKKYTTEKTMSLLKEWATMIIDISDNGEYSIGKDVWGNADNHNLKEKIRSFWNSFEQDSNHKSIKNKNIKIISRENKSLNRRIKRNKKEIEKIWEGFKKRKNGVTNGDIFCISPITENKKDSLIIPVYQTKYKNFIAQREGVELGIFPLGVSGVTILKNGDFLFAKRKNVTQYVGYLELVPSGGLNNKDYYQVLEQEFTSETGFSSKRIKKIIPLGLILDKAEGVYDICCMIKTDLTKEDLADFNSEEYEDPVIVKRREVVKFIEKNKIVPTSYYLIKNFIK